MRPKTKGETIGVQLPLAVDRWVRQQAAEAQVSSGLWLSRVATDMFRASLSGRRELLQLEADEARFRADSDG
jgi:hypothetical protein